MKKPFDSASLSRFLVDYAKKKELRLGKQGSFHCFKYGKKRLVGLTNFLNNEIYPAVKFRKRKTTVGNSSRKKGSRTHKTLNQFFKQKIFKSSIVFPFTSYMEKQMFQYLLSDLKKLKLTPIGSEVVVCSGNCGTAIDLLCCREKNWLDLVCIEMKTGYKEGLDTEFKADGALVLPEGIDLKNTSKNRHLLQTFFSAQMFNDMYKEHEFKIKKSCVVYLDTSTRDGQIQKDLHFSWFTNTLDTLSIDKSSQLLEKLKQ